MCYRFVNAVRFDVLIVVVIVLLCWLIVVCAFGLRWV